MALLTNINGKFSVSDAGAVTFNNAFTFPTADGTANYVLKTNGSGQLAWAADNDGGDITGSGTANTVTKFTGAKTIGNGPITFSGNNSIFAENVGIGITPSASFSGVEVLQLGKGMTLMGNTNDDRAAMMANLYLDSNTAFRYVMDGLAGKVAIEDGIITFGTAPSGTAGAVATVTERMRIDSSGLTTIKRTGITGVAKADMILQIGYEGNNGQNNLIGFGYNGGTNIPAYIGYTTTSGGGSTQGDLVFATRGVTTDTAPTERMRISASGNVGIGARLDVTTATAGWASIIQNTNGASDANGLLIKAGTTASEYSLKVSNSDDSTNFMVVKGNGNVGIGTTSPATMLHLDQASNDRAGGLYIERNGSNYGLSMFVNAGGYGIIGSNGDYTTDILTLDLNGGNVGIGGTSSGAKLEIIGGGYNSIRIGSNRTANTNKQSGISMNNYEGNGTSIFQTFQQNNDNSIYWGSADAGFRGVQNHYFMVNADSDATTNHITAMRITSGGNIGINTGSNTPDALLTLEASSHNQAFAGKRDATNYLWFLRNENNSGRFQIYNSSSAQTIEMTGANGNISISGTLTEGSDVRIKENIKPLKSQLEIVNKLNPVSYNKIGFEESEIGFVAQEVEEILPELVKDDEKGMKSIAYSKMNTILVKAIQELKSEVDKLKQECKCK